MLKSQGSALPRQPRAAAQRPAGKKPGKPEARKTAATVVAEISTESSFFTPQAPPHDKPGTRRTETTAEAHAPH
jgi:hypothetical protein